MCLRSERRVERGQSNSSRKRGIASLRGGQGPGSVTNTSSFFVPNVATPERAPARGPGVEMEGPVPTRPFHPATDTPDPGRRCPASLGSGAGSASGCGVSRVARPAPALTQHSSFPQWAGAFLAGPCRALLPQPHAASVPRAAAAPLTAPDLRRATASGLPPPPSASEHFRLRKPWPGAT